MQEFQNHEIPSAFLLSSQFTAKQSDHLSFSLFLTQEFATTKNIKTPQKKFGNRSLVANKSVNFHPIVSFEIPVESLFNPLSDEVKCHPKSFSDFE